MKQLTVFLEDKVGSLSKLLQTISNLDLNVRSVSTERANMSEVRLIVENPTSAQEALEELDIRSHVVDVVVVELTDKPGELAAITGKIDDEGINIDYIYGIDNSQEGKGLFAIKTEVESNRLREILSDFTLY